MTNDWCLDWRNKGKGTIEINGIFFFYLTIRKKRRGLSESDWIGKNRSVKKYVLNYQRETISRQWYCHKEGKTSLIKKLSKISKFLKWQCVFLFANRFFVDFCVATVLFLFVKKKDWGKETKSQVQTVQLETYKLIIAFYKMSQNNFVINLWNFHICWCYGSTNTYLCEHIGL